MHLTGQVQQGAAFFFQEQRVHNNNKKCAKRKMMKRKIKINENGQEGHERAVYKPTAS